MKFYPKNPCRNLSTGSNEERFLSFIPIVDALNYLNTTNLLTTFQKKLSSEALEKGISNINEATVKSGEKKGSFSVDGTSERSSIWLTACITNTISKTNFWMPVNIGMVFHALKFLKDNQDSDGKFSEYGTVPLHNDSEVSLTAFTVIAFFSGAKIIDISRFYQTIEKSLNFIEQASPNLNDNYEIAIAAYALALGERNVANLLEILEKNSYYDGFTNMMFWEKDLNAAKGSTLSAIKNEISAYAILAYVKTNKIEKAIPIVKWLVKQQNVDGQFSSYHDTAIALEALAAFASKFFSNQLDMEIDLNLPNSQKMAFKLNNNNRYELQKIKLPENLRNASLDTKGSGIVLFQVLYSYNKFSTKIDKMFNLKVTEIPMTNVSLLHLKICTSYIPENSLHLNNGKSTVEIHLPKGYVIDHQFDLYQNKNLKVNNEIYIAHIYFEYKS